MTEFIQKELVPFLVYFQIVTAIIITRYGCKFKTPVIKVFIVFFWYTVLNEFIGDFYFNYIDGKHNAIVYNVYYCIAFGYLFRLYHFYIQNKILKKVIIGFVLLYVSAVGYELIFIKMNYFKESQTVAYVVGGVSVLLCILCYFFEVLNSKKVIEVDKRIIFWIGIAYFFYYLVMVPFRVEQNHYASSESLRYLFNIRVIITLLVNLILIFGFRWSKQEER